MSPERGTPADGRSAGAQTIHRAGEINLEVTTEHRPGGGYGYPARVAHRYWATTRRCERVALRADLRLIGFGEAVTRGLVNGDALAFAPTAAEQVIA